MTDYEKTINQLREELLRLRNCLLDLRAEKFADVAKRAEVALGELMAMTKRKAQPYTAMDPDLDEQT